MSILLCNSINNSFDIQSNHAAISSCRKLSFESRAKVITSDMKKVYPNANKKLLNELGKLRNYFINYLKKDEITLKIIKQLNPKSKNINKIEINPHFVERLFERVKNGRINKPRSVIDALKHGDVFVPTDSKSLDRVIIRGNNDINVILQKEKGKWTFLSVYDTKTPFSKWIKKFSF